MDQVAQVREKVDIVSLISEYISLKKAGRNFKTQCPFHSEKSPSFVVSPERQIWHCFGCSKGGDVYTFLMEYERMEFAEALRFLANKVGITLQRQTNTGPTHSQKERLYQCNTFAKEYYHYVLTKHAVGLPARTYLEERGIQKKVIETFMLGYAPSSGSALVSYLEKKKGFTKEEILAAGLAFSTSDGMRDFFRGRLIFPLIDHRENVVGFSGRIIDGSDQSKYINTRETLIYHKSDHVYGLSVTKEAIRRTNQAIIVEGEFDVMSCFAHGVANVVAVKGTALTQGHVNLIGRFAQKITFCFDSDTAGQEAIKKSLIVVEAKGITPTVIQIPGGKDPDEALKTDPGLFKKAVKEEYGAYDYLLQQAVKNYDPSSAEGKQQISEEVLPFFVSIKNEIIKEHFLRKLSSILETSYESIQREVVRLQTKEEKKPVVRPVAKAHRTEEEKKEEYLFALIMQHEQPVHTAHMVVTKLSDVFSQETAYQKLLLHLSSYEDTEMFTTHQFARSLPKELVASFDTSLLLDVPQFTDRAKFDHEIEQIVQKLRKIYIQKRLKEIASKLQEQEDDESDEAVSLKTAYSELAAKLDTV